MRTLMLTVTLLAGLLAADPAGSQTISIRRVAGNVFVLGNNVTALIGRDGVLLVKGQDGDEQTLAALRTVTDEPVRYVIETQCDEVSPGPPHHAAAIIVAQQNVRRRFAGRKCDNDQAVLPDLTFDSELTLYFDAEEVHIIRLPAGHSDNDSLVYFRKANVVATGDAFQTDLSMGYVKYAGGNMLGVAGELRHIVSLVPAAARVIPGSGPEASVRDIRAAASTLEQMRNAVAKEVAKGRTLEELKQRNVLSPWTAKIGPALSPELYLKFFWDCLTTAPDPKFQL